MPIVYTKDNRVVLKKAKSMEIVPYVYDESVEDYVLGDTIYDIFSIIEDSITIEESDGDTTIKANEHTGKPIVTNTNKGDSKFTAQCLDIQNSILKSLFGAYIGMDETEETPVEVEGLAALPNDYPTIFALIRITFKDESIPDVYLPKVQLNSKLMMQQMKTRGSQGNISGNIIPHQVCVGKGVSVFLINFATIAGESDFIVETPVLFCPSGYTPYFLHHYEDKEYTFSQVLWNNKIGSCVTTVTVSEDDLSQLELV